MKTAMASAYLCAVIQMQLMAPVYNNPQARDTEGLRRDSEELTKTLIITLIH